MRSITGIEQEILNRLLSIEFEGVSEFRKHAMHIVGVESDCICGCPSIKLFVDRSQAPLASRLRLLPVELFELGRPSGIGCSVLCLIDNDGYIANLECVYYDDVMTEWPPSERCATILRDSDRNLSSVLLPSGVLVTPHDAGDPWASFGDSEMGFSGTTYKGWTETYDANGQLVSRDFVQPRRPPS